MSNHNLYYNSYQMTNLEKLNGAASTENVEVSKKYKDLNIMAKIKEFFVFILTVAAIVIPIRYFVAQPFVVEGKSMSPTFETSQYLLVDQLTYRFKQPARGDVVVFKQNIEDQNHVTVAEKYLIKRIIGLPNETIKIDGEDIYIKFPNQDEFVRIEEDYIEFPKSTQLEKKLAEDEFFVLGDNRANSLDSRFFGAISKKEIVGRPIWRFYPLDLFPGKIDLDKYLINS